MKRVLISGYYGFHNTGDEAILTAICQLLSPFELEIKVLTAQEDHELQGCQFQAIQRTQMAQIYQTLQNTDLFISGGGGLFQDVTGLGSIPYYGGLLWLARRLNVPTLIFSQGLGPLRMPWSRWAVSKIFHGCSGISLRDQDAIDLLKEIKGPVQRTVLSADPVLAMRGMPPGRAEEILRQEGLNPDYPIIGVSIRPWKTWYEKQLKSFTAVLSQFARQARAQLLFIPFQADQDTWMCHEAAYAIQTRPAACQPGLHVLRGNYSPLEIFSLIGQMDMIVGMRLHSLIMAAANRVPAVGIVYDPKVRSFSEMVGYPFMGSVTSLSHSDHFYQYLFTTWQEREAIRKSLDQKLPALENRVYEAVRIALQLLGIDYENFE
ncbi:polysaccharide pyruvyl transferase CsaB [bacterium (Candidatus Blackallbacteria) CG17_big_fil_post_rev_8_21_14_2_50_48_46]|uniref:Polysaccharide pyruvyl transferase CsaB n=1 Tax=bacterium (Candidatus Blackallbacteria) CG17_big_fil_post_rev_8_21_14_2_50_48_46 TaxID=2014261 RepID=A0A2M7FXZ3_9BACT|nr:MAG: polysaccharide pyruvyl transferase CsaB [bacterium (Candidatus Blackallbacteria) CG18_big_fil_WC_8_21_14_2_50_49_26]PIW14175.1 MAG: polysaccharide pyruvyl transferase CsaB [bacterium (Candidatus Blackallbacteria) CG17_big_fil_post_rev_8_21_14_2_50_48_46]PIW46716.1 MAG: polysaccharide pyruvyl transferase CsaB [bacterium (Candidatus Blackallbacteria) CG13_big_fil_rev_8_21_14_2_50_49_14]